MSQPDLSPPPATGQRIHWPQVPARVRAAIESRFGGEVVRATTQATGFSPGLAAILERRDGYRIFVKACGPEQNPQSPGIHRREIGIVSRLPPDIPVPRYLWNLDEGPKGWVALGFEAIDGRTPELPWRETDLVRVCETLNVLARRLTPSPVDPGPERTLPAVFSTSIRGWDKIAALEDPAVDDWCRRNLARLVSVESKSPLAVEGNTLVHLDIRADNVLLTDDTVYIVDWPHACIGADWVDFVGFAPSVEIQGGPEPEDLLSMFPAAREANADALTAAVAAVAGYFTWQALQPPPPGLPALRAFQDAHGVVARRWLARRTGWR